MVGTVTEQPPRHFAHGLVATPVREMTLDSERLEDYVTPEHLKWLEPLFPDGICDREGNKIPFTDIDGKFLCVFAGASKPAGVCESFVPLLKKFYEQNKDDVFVVFLPVDTNPADSDAWMAKHEMPWPYVPQASIGNVIAQSIHQLATIPSMNVYNPEGKLLTTWGRAVVSNNPEECVQEWKKGKQGLTWFQMLYRWNF